MRHILFIAVGICCLMVGIVSAAEIDSCDALFVIRANNVTFDGDHIGAQGRGSKYYLLL